jgi:DNA-binding transcriptional LysR family regulator
MDTSPMTGIADDLILFAQVATAGNFTGVARIAGLPKSTVSRRISALETALGERLLTRGARALTLTPFGEGILRLGQRMLEDATAWAVTMGRRLLPLHSRLFIDQLRDSLSPGVGPEDTAIDADS